MDPQKLAIPLLSLASLTTACTDPLVGDWECTKLDGEDMPYQYNYSYSGDYGDFTADYSMSLGIGAPNAADSRVQEALARTVDAAHRAGKYVALGAGVDPKQIAHSVDSGIDMLELGNDLGVLGAAWRRAAGEVAGTSTAGAWTAGAVAGLGAAGEVAAAVAGAGLAGFSAFAASRYCCKTSRSASRASPSRRPPSRRSGAAGSRWRGA